MRTLLFTYVSNSGTIVAGGSVTRKLDFSSDSDFHLRSIRTSGNTGVTFAVSLVSGEQLSNAPLTSSLIGSSNQGVKIFDNVIILRQTQMQITFTNSDSVSHTEEIQFWGVKS